MLKLVPFQSVWITHDKLDLKAIYRRPRYVEDAYGERIRDVGPDGQPTWDLTTPLPVKQHNKFTAKGFEYVTLADRDSLVLAARMGTIEDHRQYIQDPRTGGPWHYRKYVEGQQDAKAHAADAQKQKDTRIAELVAKYGAELVEEMQREIDPTFVLPAHLKGVQVDAHPVAEGEPVKRGPGRPRKELVS